MPVRVKKMIPSLEEKIIVFLDYGVLLKGYKGFLMLF